MEEKIDLLERRVAEMEQSMDRQQTDRERELRELTTSSGKKLASLRRSQQFFLSELDRLKEDIQSITNENEKTLQKIRTNSLADKNLQKRLGDLIISIDELKDFFRANVNISSIAAKNGKSDESDKVFKTAYKLYKGKRLKESRELFKKYRQIAPNTDLTDDSVYFVAYIYFLERKYDEAILHFFELINQFPKSNWFYDAKWWLAVSLERTEDTVAAIDIYRELERLNPDHPHRYRAKNRLAELEGK